MIVSIIRYVQVSQLDLSVKGEACSMLHYVLYNEFTMFQLMHDLCKMKSSLLARIILYEHEIVIQFQTF